MIMESAKICHLLLHFTLYLVVPPLSFKKISYPVASSAYVDVYPHYRLIIWIGTGHLIRVRGLC